MASFQRPTPSDRRVRVSVRLGKGALAKTQRNGIETKQNAQQPTPTSWRLGALARDSSHTSTSLINSWAERPVDWKKGSRKDAKGWIQDKTETHNCLHLPLGAFAPWREIPPIPQHRSSTPGPSVRSTGRKALAKTQSRKGLEQKQNGYAQQPTPTPWRLGARFLPHLNIAHQLVTRAPVRLKERALANTQSRKGLEQKLNGNAQLPTPTSWRLCALARDSSPHLNIAHQLLDRASGRLEERALAKTQSRKGME